VDRKWRSRLLLRLTGIFGVSVAIGTLMVTFNNIFLHHIPFRDLLSFNLPAMLAGDVVICAVLLTFAGCRLRAARTPRQIQERLTRLPFELFVALMIVAALLSVGYHTSWYFAHGIALSEVTRDDWISDAGAFVTEQQIALVLCVLQYALSRRAVRPVLQRLGRPDLPGKPSGVTKPLIAAYIGCSLIVSSVVPDYIVTNEGSTVEYARLAAITGLHFLYGVAVFLMLSSEIRGDLRVVAHGIRTLAEGSRSTIHGPIPVATRDEMGELAEAFNALQRRTADKYEALRQELTLAYRVQRRLLRDTSRRVGEFRVAAVSVPCKEVGGDLFDMAETDDGRLAVMIGDVSGKGLPAALLMTAAVTVFRAELRRGGGPAELLSRMNAHFVPVLQGTMYITIAIGVWDAAGGRMRYASAGHVSPYRLAPEGVEAIDCGSLPIGIDPETSYRERTIALRRGDRLIMYTDGAVECDNGDGTLFGFERFERALSELPARTAPEKQVQWLLERLPNAESRRWDDDLTIMVVAHEPEDGRFRVDGAPDEAFAMEGR